MHRSTTLKDAPVMYKNAIHAGHFGTIGKKVQKIILAIVFNFVDHSQNPSSVQNLLLD
jgi:hypothetical protein